VREGDPGWLCSAGTVKATGRGIAVADPACNQVLVFDEQELTPIGVAELDGSPRGLALTPSGSELLVPVAKPVTDGAVATFVRVTLP